MVQRHKRWLKSEITMLLWVGIRKNPGEETAREEAAIPHRLIGRLCLIGPFCHCVGSPLARVLEIEIPMRDAHGRRGADIPIVPDKATLGIHYVHFALIPGYR